MLDCILCFRVVKYEWRGKYIRRRKIRVERKKPRFVGTRVSISVRTGITLTIILGLTFYFYCIDKNFFRSITGMNKLLSNLNLIKISSI